MNAPLKKPPTPEEIAAIKALTIRLRKELAAGKDNIPPELQAMKAWLVWKVTEINPSTGKFNKIPSYPRKGHNRLGVQGSEEDRANLGSWDEARAALNRNPHLAGVGFALLPEFGVTALDIDHCISGGTIREDAANLTKDTYCEISPSGTGIRAFWRGTAKDGKNNEAGFELFHSTGFVTITGNQVANFHSIDTDELPALDDPTRATLETLAKATGKVGKVSTDAVLREAAENDPKLDAIKNAGLYERDMGSGKHSICCPFEDEHSDAGRSGGDGDTVYYQPHTGGKPYGFIHCLHSHGNDQGRYWEAIGYDINAEAINELLADFQDATDWPDPIPLPDDLPPVPAFDLDLLPASLRPWIEDIAERMQITPDIPAIGAVTALSAAIGRRVQIMPKVHDEGWIVVPNLWGMVVAPPGYMKSPALSAVMAPLHKLEREANREHESALALYEMNKERVALANSAAKSATLAKLKKDPTADMGQLQSEPDEPVATRYIVNNFSLEAVGEVLIGNPDGVLAFNDELYGLLKMADKPGNEELHAFLLQAWNGDGSFTFDRIGRGVRYIDYVCIALLGGIQPGRLIDYVTDTHNGGAVDSGFVQRFQMLTWPDLSDSWTLIDRTPNKTAQEAAHRVFERAAGVGFFSLDDNGDELVSDGPDIRHFDSDGQAAFFDWMESNERLVRGDTLPDVMRSHLSKYKSLVPSLALIFAVADNVHGDVPLRYVQQAIGWAEYLRPHAERAFASTTRPDTRHARALLAKIKSGDVADDFKPADVYWKGWAMLDRGGLEKATAFLCDLGYLLKIEKRPEGKQGGRPSTSYRINPKVKG